MRKLRFNLDSHSYHVYIGMGLLQQSGELLKELNPAGEAMIITDSRVKPLYAAPLIAGLTDAGYKGSILEVPEGEAYKSLETAGRLYVELADAFAERGTTILALGGGVIGDLAGFVAATYMRGLPLVQVPTTLLAQVDSSIGGKVAVDHGRLKNMIGAFYQPLLVITDITTLESLPPKELSNGLAEIIKHAVIKDAELFAYLEDNMDALLNRDNDVLEEVVGRNVSIKASVVEQDERDSGLRNILNFGHTVGHALEAVSDFGISHGDAVAMGMLAAGRIALGMGIFSREEQARLKQLIKRAGLPTEIPHLNPSQIISAMEHDKKIVQGRIRFVLPQGIGSVLISDEVSPSLVEQALAGDDEKT